MGARLAGSEARWEKSSTNWALGAAVLGPLLLYTVTLPRSVVLEDDGLFLMAGAEWGIAHPPGYPLYTLLCHLFMRLPFGNPAVLGHLSSAVLGAIACGAVFLCARALDARRLPALAAAWLFGASEHMWSQAIIAEVYTLNALLFFAAYALILYGVRHPHKTPVWVAAAVAYGLSLANHWPLMALAGPGLLLAAAPARQQLIAKLPLLLASASAAACLPYAWMVLRSWQEPFISFYGPIADWGAFWHYVSRSGYAETDVNPIAGWADRLAFLRWFAGQAFWQLTPPGFVLAALGLCVLLRRRFTAALAGVLVFLSNSVVLLFLLEFEFDFHRIAIFRPYSLACYGIAALWLAVGSTFILERCPAWLERARPRSRESDQRWRYGVLSTAAVACAGLVAWSVMGDWATNNRARSDVAARYVETIFELVPDQAVLIVSADAATGPLGYARFVEDRRPDVELVNVHGLVFGNRLFHPLLNESHKQEIVRRQVAGTTRPVFYVAPDEDFQHGYAVRHHGLVKEVRKAAAPGQIELAFAPAAARYFEDLLPRVPSDGWERYLRLTQLHIYGQFLGYVVLSGNTAMLEQTARVRTLAEGSFASLIGMAEVLLKFGGRAYWQQIEAWLDEAELHVDASFERWRRARLHHLKGVLLGRRGEVQGALRAFQRSYAINPHADNPSIAALEQHGIAPGTPARHSPRHEAAKLPSG